MFYEIILGTSQTVTSKAVSSAHSKNNTPLIGKTTAPQFKQLHLT